MTLDVLVVDDSVVARAFLRKTLAASKLEIGDVLQAEHGQAALDVLAERSVDVVLTDINMPVMDGVTFVGEMAGRGILDNTTVVVVSTEKNEERLAKLRGHGVKAVLCKPFGPTDLRDVLGDVVGGGGE